MEESTNVKLAATNKPFGQINNLQLNIIKDDLHIVAKPPDSLELIPLVESTNCYMNLLLDLIIKL